MDARTSDILTIMKTRFIRVTTEDKLILQGLLYEPDQKTDKVVLHIHGMAGNFYENKFLDAMAKTFTDNGWAFLTPNNRGHDYIADLPIAGNKEDSKRIGNVFEKFEECVLDVKCWMDFAQQQGFTEIVLQGHSLGCSKVAYYLSQTGDQRVKKLVLASPADMVGLAERWPDHKEMMELSKEWVKEGKGRQILPKLLEDWCYLSAETYLDFHTRGNPIDVFNTYDKEAPSKTLEDIAVPTLAFFGDVKEAYIANMAKDALDIIKSKAKKAPSFEMAVIEGASHGYFAHEQEAADLILKYLNR